MKLKLTALALSLSPLCVFPITFGVFAAPQITFVGEVTDQTCSVQINGQTDAVTVVLPPAQASDLATPGSTTGLTPFTLSLTGCSAKSTDIQTYTKFMGQSVTTAGNLANQAATAPASRVQFQLLNKAVGGTPVVLSGLTSTDGPTLAANSTSASHDFGVQYISEEGGATTGAVQSIAEYYISYN